MKTERVVQLANDLISDLQGVCVETIHEAEVRLINLFIEINNLGHGDLLSKEEPTDAEKALHLFVTDPKLKSWLEESDPQALKQAQKALKNFNIKALL